MRILGSESGAGERGRSSFSLSDRLLVVKEEASESTWVAVTVMEIDDLEFIAT